MITKSKEIVEQIRPKDKNLLDGQTLTRKFGEESDCIELHIYDLNNELLDSIYDFRDYEIPNIDDSEGYFSEITFNPDKVLRDLGYSNGEYAIQVNFHRKRISNTFENIFYIDTISPSRTELKVKLRNSENLASLIFSIEQFIFGLDGSFDLENSNQNYFKDFALNLSGDIILTGVNFINNPDEDNSFFIKLYEPLPDIYSEKTQFRIIEEITNPIRYRIDLGKLPPLTARTDELRGPNLRIDTRLNSSIPTAYRAYNDILTYTSSGSLNNVLNALSSSVPISIEYDNSNTDSGYVYDKFIHFSSAEERLRNFKYKIELVELYTSKSLYIDSLNPTYVSSIKLENEALKNKIIQNFDDYERYLYFDSGTYSWPKTTSTKPYNLYPISSSEAIDWFNTHVENAYNFDGQNPYILRNSLPQYIIDNDENEQFVTFVDMMGQYFDNIWLYIENITDKNIAHNSLKEGISKDLVFNALKEKGISAFNQFENTNLFEYLIASEGGDTFKYTAPSGQTMISSSNESLPKSDIVKEVWKRLYHNAPYLLKTKGTERGIKALLACYGIPESILHVKEYGGPSADKSGDFRTFKYPKTTKALDINGVNSTPFLEFGNFSLLTYGGQTTVEFTIVPNKKSENILVGDPYSNNFVTLTSSSIYNESGFFDFTPYGASPPPSGVFPYNEEGPFYSGRPLTFFIKPSTSQGAPGFETSFDVTVAVYIDGEYFTYNGSHNFGTKDPSDPVYRMIIGTPGTVAATDISSSFSVQHFKIYTSSLSSDIMKIHTKDPSIIAGNNTSSYFNEELYYYNPLGGNLQTESISNGYYFKDYSYGTDNSGTDVALKALKEIDYINITYNHYISTPDTVGSSMASEKVRYDAGTIDDNILSPVVRAEASALDRQPQDFSNLGIFFSPTFEINEDIIYTLGGFRLDDYIGNPRHLDSGSYPDLKSLRDEYNQKVERRYNFWDYLKTIQYFDHTVFKMIEEFVPAKANLKTGLVIEPHYLQRDKFTYSNTDFSNIEVPLFNIPETQPSVESEYILHETTIDVEQVLDGSSGSFENNFVYSRLSNKYFRISENRG